MLDFLTAQEVQAPLVLEHDWLYVGHTDEYMQFLPANNSRGWVMSVADPLAGLELLQAARDGGYGGVRAVSRPQFSYDPASACSPSDTLDDVVEGTNLADISRYCARRIEENINIIKQATGITEDEIIRIPSLFAQAGTWHWTCNSSKADISEAD